MCGRYVLYGPKSRLVESFGLTECPDFAARYNIPPQTDVLVIRHKPSTGRVGQVVRWGLVPNWAKDPSIGAKLNNARAETVAEKPSFRTAFARHRCIIPANGFYEWQVVHEGAKIRKQPHFIRPSEPREFFAFAGLLARWRAPDGTDLISTCVITTEPNAVTAPIHDRMPVILDDSDFDRWLDPDNHDSEALRGLMKPSDPAGLVAWPVSTAVNRTSVDEPSLTVPCEVAEPPATNPRGA